MIRSIHATCLTHTTHIVHITHVHATHVTPTHIHTTTHVHTSHHIHTHTHIHHTLYTHTPHIHPTRAQIHHTSTHVAHTQMSQRTLSQASRRYREGGWLPGKVVRSSSCLPRLQKATPGCLPPSAHAGATPSNTQHSTLHKKHIPQTDIDE